MWAARDVGSVVGRCKLRQETTRCPCRFGVATGNSSKRRARRSHKLCSVRGVAARIDGLPKTVKGSVRAYGPDRMCGVLTNICGNVEQGRPVDEQTKKLNAR